jgi:hypothetical protein
MLGLRCSASSNAKFLELTETVAAALEEVDRNKQERLTFDTTPASGSTNPVTSGGVYTAVTAAYDLASEAKSLAQSASVTALTASQIQAICS